MSAFENLPQHIGVIMDGNGRWAKAQGKVRSMGHKEGVIALKRLVGACVKFKVPHLTVYSFSSENWTRPQDEINFIFKLISQFVDSDLEELHRHNVRIDIVGSRENLSTDLIKTIDHVEARTKDNTGLHLNVAFNYGGQQEIVEAAQRLAQKVHSGEMTTDQISLESFGQHLFTADTPPVDLLLRTGGDQRLSNFLIWQSAYAELVFLPIFWPEFEENHFVEALKQFSSRERRFGGLPQ